MNFKTLLSIAIIILLFGITSCSFVNITSERDKNANFKEYKTVEYYGWNEGAGSFVTNNDKIIIEKSFGQEFRDRGMNIIEKDADIAVSLYLVLDRAAAQSGYKNHYIDGPYSTEGFGTNYGVTNKAYATSDFDYQTGTLIIDVFDTKTKDRIWQGIASGAINPDPLKREKNIPKTVAKIMKEFPVKVKR